MRWDGMGWYEMVDGLLDEAGGGVHKEKRRDDGGSWAVTREGVGRGPQEGDVEKSLLKPL